MTNGGKIPSERIVWTGPLRRWGGESGARNWFYFEVDGVAADEIAAIALMRRLELGRRKGFGSVKVAVQVGETRWSSSVFPQKDGCWFLPVKLEVRRAEELCEGDVAELFLEP